MAKWVGAVFFALAMSHGLARHDVGDVQRGEEETIGRSPDFFRLPGRTLGTGKFLAAKLGPELAVLPPCASPSRPRSE